MFASKLFLSFPIFWAPLESSVYERVILINVLSTAIRHVRRLKKSPSAKLSKVGKGLADIDVSRERAVQQLFDDYKVGGGWSLMIEEDK